MAKKRQHRGGRTYVNEYRNYRDEDGKVRSEFVRYLGIENPDGTITPPKTPRIKGVRLGDSYRAGDVRVLWELAEELDMVGTIDRYAFGPGTFEGPTPGKLLTAWAISRCVSPSSVRRLAEWIPQTDLPRLMGLSPEAFHRNHMYEALDQVCSDDGLTRGTIDLTPQIDAAFTRTWRDLNPLPSKEREVLAYDMTTLVMYGVTCPLGEKGHNPDHLSREQVNLAVVVSKRDKFPLAQFVYEGSRNDKSTVPNLLTRLEQTGLGPGTLLWDRGMMSARHVQAVGAAGWKLISGVPSNVGDVPMLLDTIDVPTGPDPLMRSGKVGKVYGVEVEGTVYGKRHRLIVCINRDRAVREQGSRDEALAIIGQELDKLNEDGGDWSEKDLHAKISEIVKKEYARFLDVRVTRKGDGPRVAWSWKKREIARAARRDGKWVLLCTDPDLTVKEIVNTYLEKDFIEKTFRTMKTDEEILPVRHRKEHRVRAYLFVMVLAYRLLASLQWRIKQASEAEMEAGRKADTKAKKKPKTARKGKRTADGGTDEWDSALALLEKLGRVQRTEITVGRESEPRYLNTPKALLEALAKLGLGTLFDPERDPRA